MKLQSILLLVGLTQAISLTKQNRDPSTGEIIPICNGWNTGRCTNAEDVVVKKIRRDGKRAAPGDPDYADQSSADAKLIPDPAPRVGELKGWAGVN